jgi:APA family basic amino acid/polyamine antiporter
LPGGHHVHGERRTPYVAIIATTATAIELIAAGDLGELADTTVLLLLVVFTAVTIAALVLRRDRVPHSHSHFRTPSLLPLLGAAVCIVLMATKEPETFARAEARSWSWG